MKQGSDNDKMDARNAKQQDTNANSRDNHAQDNDLHALASAENDYVSRNDTLISSAVRIDYLSLLIRAPFDYCQQIIESIKADCAEWGNAAITPLAPRVKAHGGLPSGDRGYTIEWYGIAADCMAKLLPQHLLSQASRVDYRIELDAVTEASIEAFGQYARLNVKGNRNVQTFKSRGRTKVNGRNGGGVGVAIGSHKSDTRLSVYKRKDENGAIEIQYSGKQLDTVKAQAALLMRSERATWYEAVSMVLASRLSVMASQAGFAGVDGLAFFLQDSSAQAEEATGGKDFAAYQFTTWYNRLPYHEQVDVLRGLGLTPATVIAALTGD